MSQFYQGKLAERLMQATSMERNRSLLRRGARKMQDGVLGTSDGDDIEEEPVNIHIGDQTFTQAVPAAQSTAPTTSAKTPFWQKALASAALVAGGAGIGAGTPWLLGTFERPATKQAAPVFTDADTQYRLSIMPEAPK